MKNTTALIFLLGISISTGAQAQGWFDSVKEFFGLGEKAAETVDSAETTAQPSIDGLLALLAENLNVSTEQARGGLAALLNYSKQHLDEENFASLQESLPGLDDLMAYVPEGQDSESDGLGALLDKAAEYSESLASINDLKKQFEELGLDTQMIMDYIEQVNSYFDTEDGQETKQQLMESFSKLTA